MICLEEGEALGEGRTRHSFFHGLFWLYPTYTFT